MGLKIKLSLLALDAELVSRGFNFYTLRNDDRQLSNSRHINYQTLHKSSPPTFSVLALRSVMSPFEVDKIAIPSPPSTRGTRFDVTYWRRPGFDTRTTDSIAGFFPFWYFR